jgi:uridylate kinase
MKNVIVLSLGGSLIIPENINIDFLEKFKQVLEKNKKNYKFVIVCGGGSTARKYIKGLDKKTINKEYFQGLLGIASTRLNARLLIYFFGKNANQEIPSDMKEVKNLLRTNDFVFCGALRYAKDETSDSTSAKLANLFNTDFINLTNVDGLYTKNPLIYKDAIFIPEISHKDFLKTLKKLKFKPGQHMILDQKAAKIIKKQNIDTYILGPNLKNLDSLLNFRHFIGTRISSEIN